MAYNNQCAATVGGCTRLQYFSNPMVNYTDGFAMGDGPARNNALTLNKSANAVSNYRATVVPITQTFVDVPLADPPVRLHRVHVPGRLHQRLRDGAVRYCPNNPVTRGEMAAFLERSKHGADFSKRPRAPCSPTSRRRAIRGLHRAALCRRHHQRLRPGTDLLPERPVTRAEMAKFLLKTKCGSGYTPSTPVSSPFPDVPLSNTFLPWINKLYNLGITLGCSSSPTLMYCPNDAVTRGTMAIFIYRTFPHGTPSEVCAT